MIKINPLNINDICEEYTERVISHKYKFLPNNIYSRYFETHCVDILKCPAQNLQNIISEFNILYPKNCTGAKVKKYFISLHHIKERV